MEKLEIDNITFYKFSNLKCSHWITSKPFDMHKERGIANRNGIRQLLGLEQKVVFPDQQHTGNVLVVGLAGANVSYPNCDALITTQKEVPIGVVTADCVPILIEDQVANVVAAIHAGWRGTVQRIVKKTVQKMIDEFGSKPENIFAGIGPSISPSVYEVGEDVYEEFSKNDFNNELIFRRSDNVGKYYLDLWKANQMQLLEIAVPESNVEISKMCTFTQTETLYSARRDTINTGRLAAIIKL
ncbi:MAG: peptidoglycan editing factor PgeF [Salinivirgaceae bacterium]|nr:MAG: peptidoglycan editing factor PgeF [Salinivirgaceae bacterium]